MSRVSNSLQLGWRKQPASAGIHRRQKAQRAHSSENQAGRFTERERLVLSGVFEGLAKKEIAERISVSESSVKATLQQLFSKTGVRTRSQLVRVAFGAV
jgi:DNA-binding NarL/FixJ family response regulator